MPKTYSVTNDYGEIIRLIPNVIEPVQLIGVATTEASNVVEVMAVEGLWPGMAVNIPHIPRGAFIHSFLSSTQIVLMAPKWDPVTGLATVSAENAEAEATVEDMLGVARGCSEVPIPHWYFEGTWQNVVTSTGKIQLPLINGAAVSVLMTQLEQQPWAIVPDWELAAAANALALTDTPARVAMSDSVLPVPLKRHEGEPWGVWLVTDDDGHQTTVRANPNHTIGPASDDAVLI